MVVGQEEVIVVSTIMSFTNAHSDVRSLLYIYFCMCMSNYMCVCIFS